MEALHREPALEPTPTAERELPVPTRNIVFAYPDDFRAAWHPTKPEFAAACNALSLGMPYGEPYVVASVKRALADVHDPDLVERAEAYLAQERSHYRQHRRFNELVIAQHRGLRHVERWLAWSYRTLSRRGSRNFNAAFAAGFEAVAFASARWIDKNRQSLLRGADPEAAALFCWHLAEEVEHKSVAHDVYHAIDGNRIRYSAAMATSFVLLAWFIFIGTVVQLARTRRILNPVAWLRLIGWAFGYFFDVAPTMAITALPGHHPSELADPPWLSRWLHDTEPTVDGLTCWADIAGERRDHTSPTDDVHSDS